MYVTEMKTILVMGMKDLFDAAYDDARFRELFVTLEFPNKKTEYPSIWVDFEPARDLQTAGINHIEFTSPDGAGAVHPVKRWRFAGNAVFTIASLSSLERDTLYDAIVRDFSFETATGGGQLRRHIQDNALLAVDVEWDRIATTGTSASSGTPWGTDDVIYETTIRMQLQGEFISSVTDGTLLPITSVVTYQWDDTETDPVPSGVWQ